MTPASNGQGEGAQAVARAIAEKCLAAVGYRSRGVVFTKADLAEVEQLVAKYAQAVAKKAATEARITGIKLIKRAFLAHKAELVALRAELAEAKKENGLFRGIIRAAYLDALDSIAAMTARALNTQEPERRLTHNQQLKLGRDLATYGVRESAEATAALLRAKEPESAESVPPERSV